MVISSDNNNYALRRGDGHKIHMNSLTVLPTHSLIMALEAETAVMQQSMLEVQLHIKNI